MTTIRPGSSPHKLTPTPVYIPKQPGALQSNIPGIHTELDSGYVSILLEVDFTGREDIVYHAMMRKGLLLGMDVTLGLRHFADQDHYTFVYKMAFGVPDVEPVTITGRINAQGVSVFQYVDRIWLSKAGPDFGKGDFGDVASPEVGQEVRVLFRNDFDRWRECFPEVEPLVPPTPEPAQQ